VFRSGRGVARSSSDQAEQQGCDGEGFCGFHPPWSTPENARYLAARICDSSCFDAGSSNNSR
jgi:hypothetical protein